MMCSLEGTSITISFDAAVERALDVVDHAAREREHAGREPGRGDAANRLGVLRRDGRQSGLDPLHAGLGELLGDRDLLVGVELDARLLLAVAQRDVVELDLRGQRGSLERLGLEVPGADEVVVALPGGVRHGW